MCTALLRKSAEPASWPRRAPALARRVHAHETIKPQFRARKVVCIPLLIPQPEWDKYHLFRDKSHI